MVFMARVLVLLLMNVHVLALVLGVKLEDGQHRIDHSPFSPT